MTKIDIPGFSGVNTAVNPRLLQPRTASDMLNVRIENGEIKPRYGYRNIAAAQASFTAVYGLAYLQGYSGTTEVEEYVSFENIGGNTRAYSRNVTTGAATEITNGGASVNLNASEWAAAIFDGIAYFINPNNSTPLYKHTIGTINSLTAIGIPATPTTALTYIVKYGPGGATNYTQQDYTGIDPTSAGEVAMTGAATNTGSSLLGDNTLSIRHTASTTGESSFEIDLNDGPGVKDYTYNDKFSLMLSAETAQFRFAVTGVEFRNNDGTPLVKIPSAFKLGLVTVGAPSGAAGESYALYWEYIDKTRADFDNIRYVKVIYNVLQSSSSAANNDMIVSKMYVGGVEMRQSPPDRTPGSAGLYLTYSYYFSTPGFESGLSDPLFVPNSVLAGSQPFTAIPALPPLGVHLEVTATVSGDSNVDYCRYYAQDNIDLVYRRLDTQLDSDLTLDVKLTYTDLHKLTAYSAAPFTFANVTNAFPYKGSVVWLYKGGSTNVKYSRIGQPILQKASSDSPTDPERPASFTLSDNYGDEPLGGTQIGDAAAIAGSQGVYVQFGDRPAQMTPPRKVSGSFGVAGKKAFCRWRLDNGMPVFVYVTPGGRVCGAIPGSFGGAVGNDQGDNFFLDDDIRTGAKSLKTWLLDGQSGLGYTDFSAVQVAVDERQDALVIRLGTRALKLRRPDIDGVRHWEPEDTNTGSASVTVKYLAACTKYGIRQIRSDGKFDEDEYNNSTRAFITGSNRDGGNAIASLYWQSMTFVLPDSQRTFYAKVDRETTTNTPTLTDYSTNVPAGTAITIASGVHGGKFDYSSYGANHYYKLAISENDDAYRRLELEMVLAGNRRTH